MDITDTLRKYAELKEVVRTAEEGIKTLSPIIKEHLEKEGLDKLPTSLGVFSLEKKGTWKYTEAVSNLQAEEKATGKAVQNFTTFIKFTTPKVDQVEE